MAIRQPKPGPMLDYPSRFHGRKMSAAKFLTLPEEKPYLEYIDGVVEQKPMVNAGHGRLVRRLDAIFDRYIEEHGGDAGPERRVNLGTTGNYQLPDTAFWSAESDSGDDSIPTIAVEVRSPGQSMAKLREKCAAYLRAGVRECWLIDPEVRVLERITSHETETFERDAVFASQRMPGLELRLAEFFRLLDK